MSFSIEQDPNDRARARFLSEVRRAILMALEEENQKTGMNQSRIADAIGVHRSVINRELKGYSDITLGRVAEIARALGRRPILSFQVIPFTDGSNSTKIRTQPISSTWSAGKSVSVGALRLADVGKTTILKQPHDDAAPVKQLEVQDSQS